MHFLDHISLPAVVIDIERCSRNIEVMHRKARDQQIEFRPHFKTHQSKTLGELFRDVDIKKITVSSVAMAQYFADHQWDDITIAFPVYNSQIHQLAELTKSINLNLIINNSDTLTKLDKAISNETKVSIEIDCGYHRSGFNYNDRQKVKQLIQDINQSKHLRFVGFLSHFGNTYQAKSRKEIFAIYHDSVKRLVDLRSTLGLDASSCMISIGDTPSSSVVDKFTAVDELRPGNFIFYDLMQHQLDVCQMEDISIIVAAPIIEVHGERKEVIVHAGAVHLSKEYTTDIHHRKIYGRIAIFNDKGWEVLSQSNYVSSISQEHGVIQLDSDSWENIKAHEVIGIIPVHSCLTANNFSNYFDLNGKIIHKYDCL